MQKVCKSGILMPLVCAAALVVALCAVPSTAHADDTELSKLQSQIESTAKDYDDATAKVEDLQQQIDENTARIDEINQKMPEQQDRCADAIKSMYVMQQEGFGLVSMVLESESISDFLQRIEYLDTIQNHNSSELQKLSDMKSELETTQASLDDAKNQADREADRAADALDQAKSAREEAQQKAAAQAASEAAAASANQQQEQEQAAQAAADQVAAQGGDEAAQQAAADEASAAVEPVTDTPSTDSVDWSSDKTAFVNEWAGRIDNYLAGSPMAGCGTAYAEAAWNYGVDPRWAPAISSVESTKGAYCFASYNAWGWGGSGFSSWEDGINTIVSGLASGYGSNITYSAAQKYCPPNASHWYNSCLDQMNLI